MYRRLPPEVKEKMEEALKIGVEKGYGYHRVWRMLKENGIEISKSTVRNYYYKRFPKKSKKTERYLPRKLRIELYQKVLELRRRGLMYKQIKKWIKDLYCVSPNISTISYWCRNIHSPLNGCRIPSIDFLEPTTELAYIIGVVTGDGYSATRIIRLKARDREFVEEFARCIATILKRDPPKPIWSEGQFIVGVQCKALCELLRKPFDMEKIKKFVEHCDRCKSAFLRGFFDSEGGVSKKGQIYCYNTNTQLLQYIRKILNTLGIRTSEPKICVKKGTTFFDRRNRRTYVTKKDVYYIYVRKLDALKFYQLVSFTIQRKRKRLEEYLEKRELLPTWPTTPTLLPFNQLTLTV